MKKIILFLILFLICIGNVKAEKYERGETLDYIKNNNKSYEIYKISRSDNKILYKVFVTNNFSDNFTQVISGINNVTREKVSVISYFGYGYIDHLEDKWYVVTQYLIYKCFGYKDTTLEEKYLNEINELNNLIDEYYNPITKEIKLKSNTINTLKGYDNTIIKNSNISSKIENNNLIIEPTDIGEYNIELTKKIDIGNSCEIYSNSTTMLILPGDINDIEYSIKVIAEENEQEIIEEKEEQIESNVEETTEEKEIVQQVVEVPNTGKSDIPIKLFGLSLIILGIIIIKKVTI